MKNLSKQFLNRSPPLIALVIMTLSQFLWLNDLPGLHFDEAWQLELAYRLAFLPGFQQWAGMNDYTLSVLSHLLAWILKIGSGTWQETRFVISALTLLGIFGIARLVQKRIDSKTATTFLICAALLPLSVHLRRFFIEMTGFHIFCLMIFLTGVDRLLSRKAAGTLFLLSGFILGSVSHILFFIVLPALMLALNHAQLLTDTRIRKSLAVAWTITLMLALRMALGLHSGLAIGLVGISALAILALLQATPRQWQSISRIMGATASLLPWLSIPFLVAYIGLYWSGPWAYAQVTGVFEKSWMIPNLIGIWILGALAFRNRKLPTVQILGISFFSLFLFSSVISLRQSPRYTTLPTVFLMILFSYLIAQSQSRTFRRWMISGFVLWNSFLFYEAYARPYQNAGAIDRDFSIRIFHLFKDNARDFRPIHRILLDLEGLGCSMPIESPAPPMKDISDRITTPTLALGHLIERAHAFPKNCPWPQGSYQINTTGKALLKKNDNWGDLGLWSIP